MTYAIDDVHNAPLDEPPFDLAGVVAPDRILPPGLYFDLDESAYHGSFALSYSGIKDLRISTLTWWAKSPLNPRQAEVLEEEGPSSEAKMLGQAFDARIICGPEYFAARYARALSHADHPTSLRTADDLKGWLEDRGLPKTGKTKQVLIDRVLEADPTAQIFDVMLDGYRQEHEGKTFLESKWLDKIEVAAKLIEAHPELSKALQNGAPQVSVIWDCPKTGVRCRARFDYLKSRLITDLKTFEPRGDMPLDMAIGKEIGFRKYYVQASFYREAAAQIPRLIRDGKVFGTAPDGFLAPLAKHPDKEWAWIFQIKGPAPIAYGYTLPKSSMLWSLGETICDNAKHQFRHCLETYGSDPWVDPKGFQALDDANVPAWSLQ